MTRKKAVKKTGQEEKHFIKEGGGLFSGNDCKGNMT